MQYEMRRPTTEAEAVAILDAALMVIWQQIEFYRGDRKRAWNGDYVNNARAEAVHAVAWLADRHPNTDAARAFDLGFQAAGGSVSATPVISKPR